MGNREISPPIVPAGAQVFGEDLREAAKDANASPTHLQQPSDSLYPRSLTVTAATAVKLYANAVIQSGEK